MPICPECRRASVAYGPGTCPGCGWERSELSGLPDFLNRGDHESGLFGAYRELYDTIADDDLATSIQSPARLRSEACDILEAVGPVAGKDVCEIGVGQGALVRLLLEQDPSSVIGVDLAATYLQRLARDDPRLHLIVANAENLPFRSELDVLVVSDVLEHVLNAADLLGGCADALRPGGRLVVKVPYRENLSQYRTHTGNCPYPMVHLRTFDRSVLRQTIEDAGMRVESFSYGGFYLDRIRPALTWAFPVRDGLTRGLRRLYKADGNELTGIPPLLGRALIKPVTITAVAHTVSQLGRFHL